MGLYKFWSTEYERVFINIGVWSMKKGSYKYSSMRYERGLHKYCSMEYERRLQNTGVWSIKGGRTINVVCSMKGVCTNIGVLSMKGSRGSWPSPFLALFSILFSGQSGKILAQV